MLLYISIIVWEFQCSWWNEFLCICWQHRRWHCSSDYNTDQN